ncbi:arylsulfatase J-like [Rhipicephalus sanguineus]|uniref:arylsulfatase J-like n=1 Tax=Rhipicephalus sanguineus TaxID=34632 RepID=UPI0020C24033|nr:arylsulfatase J-like [Rhipicephalus sanguineus]
MPPGSKDCEPPPEAPPSSSTEDLKYMALAHASKVALPLRFEVLPQWLKRLGYSTHMIGKWHLGFDSFEYTPTGRGFDTFFGYYNGDEFYYNHTSVQEGHCGLDFWHNIGNRTQVITDLNGTYSTHAYTDEAKRIIASHNNEEVSSSCALEVMDRSIGEVLVALQSRGMLADSIVAFVSDNGGAPLKGVPAANSGSNWPLRGAKSSVWEGGMRTPAVFWYGRLSGRLPQPPLHRIVHIVDWAPTFYAAAESQ